MRTILYFAFCLAALLAGAERAGAQAPGYRVVVNAANSTSSITRDELARVYLKKMTAWKSGAPVAVVDQSPRSAVRAQFSSAILGRDVPTMKNYWQQSLFSGRGVPPVEQASDEQVLSFVASNQGAIGYVSPGASLPSSVKVVEITR
ncbi:MAG: phosphate ABC transporter substrate-binding protein [Gemmatimonadaceae bacterium]